VSWPDVCGTARKRPPATTQLAAATGASSAPDQSPAASARLGEANIGQARQYRRGSGGALFTTP